MATYWFGKKSNGTFWEGLDKLTGGFLGSFTGAHQSQADIDAQNFEAAQAEIARDWQEQQYLKYNSPKALVEQYQSAGINPALMFGGSTPEASTSAPGVPSGSVGASQSPGESLNSVIDAVSKIKMLRAQIDNLKADTESKKAGAHNQESQAVLNEIDSKWRDAIHGANIGLSNAQERNTDADTLLKDIEAKFKPELLEQSLEKGEIDIEQAKLALLVTQGQIRQLAADNALTWSKVETEKTIRALNGALTVMNEANARHLNAEALLDEIRGSTYYVTGFDPDATIYQLPSQLGTRTLAWLHKLFGK